MRVEHEQVAARFMFHLRVAIYHRLVIELFIMLGPRSVCPYSQFPHFGMTYPIKSRSLQGTFGLDAGLYPMKHLARREGSFTAYKENHRLVDYASRREGAKVKRESVASRGNFGLSLPRRIIVL